MKKLKKLLEGVPRLELVGSENTVIETIRFEVGKVNEKDMFFALNAYGIDGHQFIPKAIDRGAGVIVCESIPEKTKDHITYVKVENTLDAISLITANYYDNPTQKLKMVGVTGTNGKTSTVTLLHQIFRKLGHNTGLLSSITNKVNDQEFATKKTTPHATDVQRLCRMMVDEGCQYCFMELSSHGIHQRRVTGVHFAGAVFTNITHDHLDYHGSFEEYFQVKKGFLDSVDFPSFVICNVDDPHSRKMTADVKADLKSLSLKGNEADFSCKILTNELSGLVIHLEGETVKLQLRAEYNAYNILSAYAVAVSLGLNGSDVIEVLPQLKPVEGRFDYIQSKNGVIGMVDYAHTPDALINLYSTLTRFVTNRLISVIGCAGDRDRDKRPEMTKLAYENSDFLILTSDNPRTEDPTQIFSDMESGLTPDDVNFKTIPDRKKAIEYACSIAKNNDIILLAGKGHEKYQEINGIRHEWDDKLTLSKALGIV